MSMYRPFLAEIEKSDNPQKTIEDLQRMVCGVLDDGPIRVGIQLAGDYLAALIDYRNPHNLPLLSSYMEVVEALDFTLEQGKQDLEAAWALWKASIDQKGAANPCGN